MAGELNIAPKSNSGSIGISSTLPNPLDRRYRPLHVPVYIKLFHFDEPNEISHWPIGRPQLFTVLSQSGGNRHL